MDKIRQKAQSLLEKLHDKYGLQSKQHIHLVVATMGKQEGGGADSLDHWFLVDTHGQKFRLPRTMLFLGREECDVVVASQSVDKRHAILAYDLYLNRFKVKDLSSTNGTFVNNCRIPQQEYVTLNHMDSIRLGQEAMMYHMEQASQITQHGGQLPDPHFIPSWATARDSPTIHVLPHPLGECQGCIAEQNIEHTCHFRHDRLHEDYLHLDDLHHHHHHYSFPHTARELSREHHQFPVMAPLISQDPGGLSQYQQFDQVLAQHDHVDFSRCRTVSSEDQTLLTDKTSGKLKDAPLMSRDPGGLPQPQQFDQVLAQHDHVDFSRCRTLSSEDQTLLTDKTSGKLRDAPLISRDPGGLPQHQQFDQVLAQHKDDHVDFSRCRTVSSEDKTLLTDKTSGKLRDAPSLDRSTCPEKRQPILKNLMLNPAASRPDSDDPTSMNAQTMFFVPLLDHDNSACNSSNSSQTADYGMHQQHSSKYCKSPGDGSGASTCSPPLGPTSDRLEAARSPAAGVSKTATMEDQHKKLPKGPTYMEIPLRDDDTSSDVNGSGSSSAASENINSSLAKGSLLGSPHQKQPGQTCETQSPGPEMNPATSFTVELTDSEHPPTKCLNICSSISEFVPSKMRKSFQGRKTVSSKASKNSDHLELAAITQSKVEDTVVDNHGKSRLASRQTTAVTSLRPPNLGDISRLSESSEQRASQEKEADKKGPGKKARPSKSPQIPQPPTVTSSSSSRSVPTSSAVLMSDYQHPANYLFDKMFEGGNCPPAWTSQEHFCEHEQLKEVDRWGKAGCLPTEKTLIRPVIDSTSYQGKINTAHPATALIVDNSDEFEEDDLQIIEDTPYVGKEFGEKDDREDKVSEAGTYTIEADDLSEGQEEEEARRRIGLVFGVDDIDGEGVAGSQQQVNGHIPVDELGGYEDVYDDSENTLQDNSSHSPEEDTDYILDDFDDETGNVATTNGVPTWVSQLTSLANQKSAASNRFSQEEGTASLSKKPPHGVNRKRSGTGRKLPPIPSDKSPPGHTNNLSGICPHLLSEDAGEVFTYDVSGRNSSDYSSKSGSVSSQALSSRNSSDYSNKSGSVSSQTLSSTTTNRCPASPEMRSGSRNNNGDTEIPLQGSVTVSSSMSYKSSQAKKVSQHSSADTASTLALVNGGSNYVTPVLYKSPRDALAKRQQKDWSTKSVAATSTAPASLGKKLSGKIISPTVPNPKAVPTSRGTPSAGAAKKPYSADAFSRKDSADNGNTISDLSSGDGSLSSLSSKGKATITLTRTNKTFHLRRARAGSLDEPLPARLTKEVPPPMCVKPSSSKSGAVSSAGRPHSGYSSSKSKVVENTSHSETASLAKKSQSNTTQVTLRKAGSTILSRTDSGIHSLSQKLQRASSLTITQPTSGGKGEPIPKSHLRSTPTGRSSLTIRGISSLSSKSHSQPGSRSSSPKAAEKMAWKRRKEYDARKSVAEARVSKTKDISTSGVTMRHKPSENISTDRRMIRSASFTNSAGLPLCLHNSVSISQEFTDRRDSYHQHYDLRRAFLPFHNSSHHSGRSSQSADEDDSITSAASAQDSTKSFVSLLEIPSAFTPPLLRNKPVSPESSSPSEASLSLRRRTLNMDQESSTTAMKSPNTRVASQDMEHPPQPSYDSLIAASVHQLSQKLTRSTDVMLIKLREQKQTSHSPSPDDDDFLNDSGKSEITAWKTANQELASTLKNLRMLERHVQVINAVIFPDLDISSEVSQDVPANQQGKQKLLEDIERKLGFQPIDQPHPGEDEVVSPEMVEISGQF